jgi:hypothetical protein
MAGSKRDLGAPPEAKELAARLGEASKVWDALVAEVGRAFGPVAGRWGRAGAKYPWTYAVEGGGRKLVYLVAGEASFGATVVMGEKAIARALEEGVGPEVRAAIEGARKYVEGRPVRLEVRGVSDVDAVVGLVRCKLAATGAAPKAGRAGGGGRARHGARL